MIRRRRTATALVLAVTAISACRQEQAPASAAEVLRARIETAPDPAVLEFTYSAAGTAVASCFRPNREFTGFVDQEAGVLAIRRGADPSSETIAVSTPNETVIASSLVRSVTAESAWLRLPTVLPATARDPLRRALGPDLAAYLLAGTLPPSPRDSVLAVLETAESVRSAGRQVIDGTAATGWLIDVDAEAFEDGVARETASTTPGPAPVPQVVVWLDRQRNITRVEVRLDREEGAGAPRSDTPGGWVIDYRRLDERPPLPDFTTVADIGQPGLAALEARPIETCEVPL